MRNNGQCDCHGVFVFDVNDNGCTAMLTLYCTGECNCILYLCIFVLVTSTDLKLRSVYYNDYFYAAAHTKKSRLYERYQCVSMRSEKLYWKVQSRPSVVVVMKGNFYSLLISCVDM